MLDGGTNCGKVGTTMAAHMVRGTIAGGAVFGPTGPLAARTTYGVIVPCLISVYAQI